MKNATTEPSKAEESQDRGAHSVTMPFGNEDVDALFDMSAPQPRYRELVERGGLVEVMPGCAFAFAAPLSEFVLKHHELFSSRVQMHLGNVRPLIPLNVDPPQHAQYRRLLDPIFSPRQMDRQEADISRRANQFIDLFIDRGTCNFTEEFAEVFPSSVFLGLIGLPEADLRTFLHMRDGILHPEKIDPEALVDVQRRTAVMNRAGEEIYSYFTALIKDRKRQPGNDIVSRLVRAEIDGGQLGTDEILDIMFLFVIAGLDTVSDSLTCFFAFLATHPDHRNQIVEDPTIIPAAVEELLRWESPVPSGAPRVATRGVTMPDGTEVAAGTAVIVSYGAANVDPSAHPDGFEVRFDRKVNRHVAFGAGVHRCLGSHLARRELRVTLREWHRRIPDYWLTPGHERLEFPPGLRHVKDLMISWA